MTLRWSDADRYGHVNNTVYYQWFDVAVNEWLIAAGLLDLAGDGPLGFVVETGCRYARPIDFPGAVDIGLVVESVGGSSVRYRLGVFAEGSGDAAAEGRFVHVYVDRATRRPHPLPIGWLERLTVLSPAGR